MATTHSTLDAAAASRKERLAQLRSLKRKQPPTEDSTTTEPTTSEQATTQEPPDVTNLYLSGRNYDATSRGPKLGFDIAPNSNQVTVEERAKQSIGEQKAKEQEEARRNGGEIDLFALQPRERNWDLKRELRRKTEILDVRTDNAIARLVRERLAKTVDGKEQVDGLEGSTLVEGIKVRERELEAERQMDEDDDL